MPRVSRFTPLSEIQAVVLDTETTGLDVATCRLAQISAVRVIQGEVKRDQIFDRLVNPGIPIPPQATVVHGITDAMVAAAPPFAAVKPDLDRYAGDAVLVGQSIGFDLAVLLRETRLAGATWREPQFLDTKLLAAALDPAARELDLDALAAQLGVSISDRHRALGDALVTAEIFVRLLPRLAAAGVRTLGDAQARADAQTRIRARHADQGWYDATSIRPPDAFEAGADAPALLHLQTFAYRCRIEHLMNRSPVILPPATQMAEAIRRMADENLQAVLAGDPESGRADGIFTQSDVVRAIAGAGAAALELKLEAVMSAPVAAMPADAFVYRALARMQRLGVGQLPVEDASRRVVGIISLRDLSADEAAHAVVMGDRLSTAPTPRALATVRAELPGLARRLLCEGVPAAEVSAVLSAELRELLARATVLAEKRMEAEGAGRPPVPYALLALGRLGRAESLFDTEAEHALVFASGSTSGSETHWFAAFSAHLAEVLRAAGAAPTNGGAIAADTAWRRNLQDWRTQVASWADAATAPDAAALFFDFRLAYGDQELAEDLRVVAFDAAGARLARALSPARRDPPPPGSPTLTHLIAAGLDPIEAAARSLAVAGRIAALSSAERLAEACSHTGLSRHTADDLTELHEKLLSLCLAQQAGTADLSRLEPAEREELDEVLRRTAHIGDVVRMALALV